MFLAPKLFLGQGPDFLDLHYKIQPDVAKFHTVIGRGSSEILWRNKKRIKYLLQNIRPFGTTVPTVPGGLISWNVSITCPPGLCVQMYQEWRPSCHHGQPLVQEGFLAVAISDMSDAPS